MRREQRRRRGRRDSFGKNLSISKCHSMQGLAIRCKAGAFCRKPCRDTTNFGKLLSRLLVAHPPQPWMLLVWVKGKPSRVTATT
jgi:hypothetical protein